MHGTGDQQTAIQMLKDQGHGLIAVIEDDICIEEITFEEVVR